MSIINKWKVLDELDQHLLSKIKFVCIFGHESDEVLIVTNSEKVYAFGTNRSGCLGLGHNKSVKEPNIVSELWKKGVINIAYGYNHVMAITRSGHCYSWGDNICGQLGYYSKVNSYKPKLVEEMSGKVIDISCGSFHSLILTETGLVYGFGQNFWGQMGCNSNENQFKPIIINGLLNHSRVIAISCGNYHSMVLTDLGFVYSWGNNRNGQLGIGDKVDRNIPHKVDMNGVIVTKIICGQFHSLLLATDGSLYAFGHNDCGQIGCGNNITQCSPVKVKTSEKFVEIASEFRSDISVAKSENGLCFVWGKCDNKLISIPMKTPINSIHDIFAIYAKRKTTYRPMELNVRPTSSPILEKIKDAFNTPELSDFTFKFADNVIYVNKSYLKIRSEHFRALFSEILTGNEAEIVLNSYEAHFALLKYLYTDSVDIEVENAIELYYLAECSSEEELKLECTEIIKNGITIDNAFTLYSSAVKYQIEELEDICTLFAAKNMKKVIMTDAFEALDSQLCKRFVRNAGKLEFFD